MVINRKVLYLIYIRGREIAPWEFQTIKQGKW